jgi:IS30 family transposase
MGRKKIEVNWEEFNKLCEIQCTLMEIAHWFNCSEDTIERRVKEKHNMLFADYYKKESAGGRISLRRKQNEVAQAGSVPMLIWLGKQYLGQSEKVESKLGTIADNKIRIEFV